MKGLAEIALQFINSTCGHVFLTGKAGTGKTTFLKSLSEHTHKQFAVVAPTGIAALNAGGVTIHSQFLLPLGTFLPSQSIPDGVNAEESVYTQNTLARKHPLNSIRKQVLRSIDLLVIDEVSMLRADVLDAIDYRLRSARGNFSRSFGGVQLLLIGDLYQLPPVVRRNEESLMRQFYSTPWFYESKALKQDGFVYIELEKIFRQQDDTFIHILNNLRNNTPSISDITALNQYYLPPDDIANLKEIITLTTHNFKADEMNRDALRNLDSASHFFEAKVEGDFPESMYPVQFDLELKEGAQIMFIRNDSENQMYFNGKLATVRKIAGASIQVILAETGNLFELKREIWENKKYTLNRETSDLDDEVVGTFSQYPVKLAWAITVHKSQGLTFDKAIIDVEQAFTGGQVYVALSRLRGLDGLVLRKEIDPIVISTDKQIVSFTKENNHPAKLPDVMKQKQKDFISQLIERTFDFDGLIKEIDYVNKHKNEIATLADESMQPVLTQLSQAFHAEKENTTKFKRQLRNLLEEGNAPQLVDRMQKGGDYYRTLVFQALKKLLLYLQEMKQHKRVKTYVNGLEELDQYLMKKLEELDKSGALVECILKNNDSYDFTQQENDRLLKRKEILGEIKREIPDGSTKKKKGKKGSKKNGGPSTYEVTLQLLESGMSIEEIAKDRGLVLSTIEGHLAKAVGSGLISIFKFMKTEEVEEVIAAIKTLPEEFGSKDLYERLQGRYSYGQLRAVVSYMKSSQTSTNL